MVDPSDVKRKLALLKKRDGKYEIFGASRHKYRLNRCLTENDVRKIEKRYKIGLPEDYRTFMIEVGNGGAGPHHGLFKLGEEDDGFSFVTWEKGALLGNPSKPFKHAKKWNLPKSFWDKEPDSDKLDEDEYDEAMEEWEELLNKQYCDPGIMNGAVPICHLGCALRQWLVVTGKERGNIWCDDTADFGGIYPLLKKKRRVGFLQWYIDWLDACIAKSR